MAIEDLRGRALYDALMELRPEGLTEGEWAIRAGLNRGFFSDLKSKDGRPRIDTLRKLLRLADEAAGELPPREPDQPLLTYSGDGEDMVEIIKLDLRFSMGPGTSIDDYIEETPVRFAPDYLRTFTRTPHTRLRLAEGVGESMFPTLLTNDLVWIDTTQTILNQQDRIWAISLHGAAAIKRLRTIGKGRILVISDNPAVENQEVDAEDLMIGGRVIRFAREL